jgi:hypothetical protein
MCSGKSWRGRTKGIDDTWYAGWAQLAEDMMDDIPFSPVRIGSEYGSLHFV